MLNTCFLKEKEWEVEYESYGTLMNATRLNHDSGYDCCVNVLKYMKSI